MQVPCPVGSLQPWSPVGYTIVTVADEKVPTTTMSETALPSAKAKAVPNSPIGYRIVVTSDEQVPMTPRPRLPRPRWRERKPAPRRNNTWTQLLILGGVAALFLGPIILWTLTVTRWSPDAGMPMAQAVVPQEIQVVNLDALQDEQGPKDGAAKPAPVKGKALAAFPKVAQDQCVDCGQEAVPEPGEAAPPRPREPENFGTQVQFLHNAQAAAKAAKEDNKLTYLLHVSGNFEKDEFT